MCLVGKAHCGFPYTPGPLHKHVIWPVDHDFAHRIVGQQLLEWSQSADVRRNSLHESLAFGLRQHDIIFLDDGIDCVGDMPLEALDVTNFCLETGVELA